MFTPNDDGREMIVIQKKGIVTVWHDVDMDYSYAVHTVALDMSDIVCSNGERALGGVQLHPDFSVHQNRYIYLYYTYDATGQCLQDDAEHGPVNRLSRFVLSESWKIDPSTETVLLQTPPLTTRVHNGGKIEFGKDGYLYLSIGDLGHKEEAQSLQNLFGSMIRLTADGGIPPDNPFAQDPNSHRCNVNGRLPESVQQQQRQDGKCQELYAVGLRNPWRFAMNPNTEGSKVQYYINDVGGETWEEINNGGDDYRTSRDVLGITNYGWPRREGPCGHQNTPREKRTTDCHNYNGFHQPLHFFHHPAEGAAVTGGAFIPNGIWPPADTYDNGYLYTDYVSGQVYLLRNGNGNDATTTTTTACLTTCNPVTSGRNVTEFFTDSRIPTMRFGPYKGGTMALYYTSNANGGSMRRIYYAAAAVAADPVGEESEVPVNRPPVASIDVNASWVEEGETILFSGKASTDPDNGDNLMYEWDFDGDGVVDSRLSEDSSQFSTTGVYQSTLTVQDGHGGKSTASEHVIVGTPTTGGYPGVVFPWFSANETSCPEGYDFCGILEFCEGENDENTTVFGYRLPCPEGDCECPGGSGPIIRLVPGTKYRLTLRNSALQDTNLHTHGLHIVGSGDSDDVTRTVSAEGYCLDYTWDIASDHPGGTYWYHAHHHGLAEMQVGGGAYGMLIVEDNDSLHSSLPSWTENELLLQIVKTEHVVKGNSRRNDLIVVNATQWYRLRVSIVSIEGIPLNLTFGEGGKDDCDVHKVASDGVWRSVVPGPKARIFELSGASRADFAIRCNNTGSLIPLYYGNEIASTIFVLDAPDSAETSHIHIMEDWFPVRPYALADLLNETVPQENTFTVTLGYDHVNSLQWNPAIPVATIGYNQVHEWTLRGTAEHPFHLHLYHMQIASPGGCGAHHEEGEFYDVIASTEDCVIRFRTADIGQRCVLHCHVLFHEDNGSMSWVNVTGPNMPINNEVSPQYACALTEEPQESSSFSPTSQPFVTVAPDENSTSSSASCKTMLPTAILLNTGEKLKTGEYIESRVLDRYLIQQNDGSLALISGSPANGPDGGTVLWQSNIPKERRRFGDYFSALQRDGNFVTRPVFENGLPVGRTVWDSATGRSGTKDDYFLALNCNGTMSIFQGTPENPGEDIWSASERL